MFVVTLMQHVMKLCRFIHTVIRCGHTQAETGTDTSLYRGSLKSRGLSCLTAVAFQTFILGNAHSNLSQNTGYTYSELS
jgi:hypothetical protein